MIVNDEQHEAGHGFDPRYDPQFQRGYRPQAGERPRTRLRAAPEPVSVPEGERLPRGADGREAAARDGRGREGDRPAEAAALTIAAVGTPGIPFVSGGVQPPAADAGADRAEVARASPVPSPGVLDRIELSPRRNPLILALWLIGGGFVVLGIVLYSVSVSLSYTGSTPSTDVGSLVISQLGWMLAGPLITIGLATLVGLLFLTALAGRRGAAPGPRADEPGPEDQGEPRGY